MNIDEGPAYTSGTSYRARAEARQRVYRANTLRVPHREHGHWLSKEATADGKNFILEEAHLAARKREAEGKGVDDRTFENMLSSQAMGFNVFAPLTARLGFATEVLKPFIDGLTEVTAIHLEHTPARDVLNDQFGRGGVDCDLLVEGNTTHGKLLHVIETKFVETEFSVCRIKKKRAGKSEKRGCPDDVCVRDDRETCLYVGEKNYLYWQRSDEHALLAPGAVPQFGCPFSGQYWQLWVNLALAHEEAARRDATDVRFAVCCSSSNKTLLGDGEVLEGFKSLLQNPDEVSLIDLEALIARIQDCAPAELSSWTDGLMARYGGI